MGKFIRFLLLAILVSGCAENKKNEENNALSIEDSCVVLADSMPVPISEVIFTEPDGLFSDFIFRFMQDSLFQLDRIQFPVTVKVDGVARSIAKNTWTYDSLHSANNEYTLIYNGPEVQESSSVENANFVVYEVVDLKNNYISLYHFSRQAKKWMLTQVERQILEKDYDCGFYDFYRHFANDEDYQFSHIHDPFYFRTYDDDRFEEIVGWVPAVQWPDYRTYLPTETINNTIYGKYKGSSNYRTFVICSPSTGMNCTLVFKKYKETWELVRLEN